MEEINHWSLHSLIESEHKYFFKKNYSLLRKSNKHVAYSSVVARAFEETELVEWIYDYKNEIY